MPVGSPVGLWSCPEHGLTGPEACCGRASFAAVGPAGVSTAPADASVAIPAPASPCGVPGCYVCEGRVGRPRPPGTE